MKRELAVTMAAILTLLSGYGDATANDALTVTPSTELIDGQWVELEQSLVIPGTIITVGVTVETCLTNWTDTRPCNEATLSRNFESDLDAAQTARFVEADDGSVIDCADVECSLVYTETACVFRGQPIGTCAFIESASVESPITFAGGPGVGTLGLWNTDNEIRVVATEMAAAGEDGPAAAFAVQCAFLQAGGLACGGGSGAVENDFDGEYDETLTLQTSFTQDGKEARCSVDICVVVVIVLGAGYEIIDTHATYRQWGQFPA